MIDDEALEAAAKAHHEDARDAYMRVAGYGTTQRYDELPESTREYARRRFAVALATYNAVMATEHATETF